MIKVNNISVTDLSHLLTSGMPVFPGSDEVILKNAANVTEDGYNEVKFKISGHTGTHIDCGRHMFNDGFDASTFPIDRFTGPALVINCQDTGSLIDEAVLKKHEERIIKTDFLLLHTGWDRHWKSEPYFRNFPVLTTEAAKYLKTFDLKGIGVDAPSFDPVDSKDFRVHHLLLSAGIVLIENLTNLESVINKEFMFCCFPLKIENGDGSPVRAVAVELR
jgi:kynurenine formamidase